MDEVETFQATKVDCICAQKYKKWSLGGGRGGIITVESKKKERNGDYFER